MDFRRLLPEIRWQSRLSPVSGTGSPDWFFDAVPGFAQPEAGANGQSPGTGFSLSTPACVPHFSQLLTVGAPIGALSVSERVFVSAKSRGPRIRAQPILAWAARLGIRALLERARADAER
jgi:hypothetical protein